MFRHERSLPAQNENAPSSTIILLGTIPISARRRESKWSFLFGQRKNRTFQDLHRFPDTPFCSLNGSCPSRFPIRNPILLGRGSRSVCAVSMINHEQMVLFNKILSISSLLFGTKFRKQSIFKLSRTFKPPSIPAHPQTCKSRHYWKVGTGTFA